MGTPGVRMYHDQALYKEGKGGFTPWHADQYYWPLASTHCVTAWIPLQGTPMELGPLGIRVNSIHPGAIDTDMARQGLEGLDVSLPPIPINRIGRPEEVAELALFLASDDSGYCTGGEFVIDGGWIAGVSL
jgi:NAD(P)-dependent dehydrogenase (short-subunit alcohol dehydrogenase family)